MECINILLDGYEYEYVKYNNTHYLFGINEAKGVIVANKNYDKALMQARQTLVYILKQNKKVG